MLNYWSFNLWRICSALCALLICILDDQSSESWAFLPAIIFRLGLRKKKNKQNPVKATCCAPHSPIILRVPPPTITLVLISYSDIPVTLPNHHTSLLPPSLRPKLNWVHRRLGNAVLKVGMGGWRCREKKKESRTSREAGAVEEQIAIINSGVGLTANKYIQYRTRKRTEHAHSPPVNRREVSCK